MKLLNEDRQVPLTGKSLRTKVEEIRWVKKTLPVRVCRWRVEEGGGLCAGGWINGYFLDCLDA